MGDPTPSSDPASTALQFDRAEYQEPESGPLQCGSCQTPLYSSYYELNGLPCCERCRYEAEANFRPSPGLGGFLKAAGAGLGAGLEGAGIYYAILAAPGSEFGLIAILGGAMVGGAVRWGCGGFGGWKYQSLAIVLTYMAIVSTYVPLIVAEMQNAASECSVRSDSRSVTSNVWWKK